MIDLKYKKVIVFGGTGFLGQHLGKVLKARGAHPIGLFGRDYDLTLQGEADEAIDNWKPDIVIHAAAPEGGGGIHYASSHPASLASGALVMGANVLEACKDAGIEKFVGIGSACSYPSGVSVPTKESSLWEGYPEESHASYGLAKRMLAEQTKAYKKEFGLNGIHLILSNLYGPGDKFNPSDPKVGHVIPATINKMRGNASEIICWGTGSPTRDFLYVEDAAEGIVRAIENYESSEPLNLGTGKEISIRDTVWEIKRQMGWKGQIKWDSSKPDGQTRRCLDISRMEKYLYWSPSTELGEGLRKTLEWLDEAKRD